MNDKGSNTTYLSLDSITPISSTSMPSFNGVNPISKISTLISPQRIDDIKKKKDFGCNIFPWKFKTNNNITESTYLYQSYIKNIVGSISWDSYLKKVLSKSYINGYGRITNDSKDYINNFFKSCWNDLGSFQFIIAPHDCQINIKIDLSVIPIVTKFGLENCPTYSEFVYKYLLSKTDYPTLFEFSDHLDGENDLYNKIEKELENNISFKNSKSKTYPQITAICSMNKLNINLTLFQNVSLVKTTEMIFVLYCKPFILFIAMYERTITREINQTDASIQETSKYLRNYFFSVIDKTPNLGLDQFLDDKGIKFIEYFENKYALSVIG